MTNEVSSSRKEWERYEDAARQVLRDLHDVLGLHSVGDKTTVQGTSTDWEVDILASKSGGGLVIVEVKRWPSKRINKATVGSLAFQVSDMGAVTGITVSPLPLQSGAKEVSDSQGFNHLQLTADSSSVRYLAEFMGRMFFGAAIVESAPITDAQSAVLGWAPGCGPT